MVRALGRSGQLDGDTAIVGAPKDGDMGPQSGSAYVFTRSGGTWTKSQRTGLVALPKLDRTTKPRAVKVPKGKAS